MKFLKLIQSETEIDKSLEYDVLYYNSTSTSVTVKETNPITSTTYEVKNISNPTSLPYNATSMVVSFTGIKTETYKKGQVEVTETSETETVSFEANTSSAETATRSGSFEWNEQSVAWSTTLGIVPAIKITMQDAYTDTSVIALSAEKSASVEGTIAWSTNLASGTAKIDNGSIVFLKHYEGNVNVTATTANATANKSITVTCDEVPTATTYELGTQSAIADVPANTTSATVNYTVIPTYHYKLKDDFVGDPISTSKVVTFEVNTSTTEEDTKSGSFTDSYGVTVEWSVKQLVVPAITITVGDTLDTDIIALTATKNATAQGDITWSCNLASSVAEINGSTLTFKQHYEGSVTLTATASNASAKKTISVTCEEVATATTYSIKVGSISVAETQPMEASSTSATVNFVGITTQHYKLKDSVNVESNESQTVEFEANETSELATRNGSFEWNGESVAWEVELKAKETSYEMVDLGLPSGTLWATCNVGATKPEEYGMYFRWGETTGHYQTGSVTGDSYNWVNTPFQTQSTTEWSQTKFTKYLGSTTSPYKDPSATNKNASKTVLDPEDDAAHVNMGGDWRMPTTADTVELVNNTTSEWVSNYEGTGVAGRKFTSKVEGNTNYIFIPAAGYCNSGSMNRIGTGAYVWSSSLDTSYPYNAYRLYFNSSGVYPQNYDYRCSGVSVRGVKPKS